MNLQSNEMTALVKAVVKGTGIANISCDLANPSLKRAEQAEVLLEYYSSGHNLWTVYLSRNYQ
ncbi:hypothetical protein I6F40_17280 [Pseudoalteromonas sp. SWXJ133]|uniref:hypothetical protein n=1 Tax=Pseudoalteromonas sp. SWXJ133 TaxID=2792069 RepID=UPI0018CFED4A|nr:hypothetical protein [Pseudoalteromonas sp. SWXJ133]MBH0022078.1 hypothetical protein [Pseudoalteromonas sp. SWXJ133]